MSEAFMTRAEVMRMLGIKSQSTFYSWQRKFGLPRAKIGHKYLKKDIEEFVRKVEEERSGK